MAAAKNFTLSSLVPEPLTFTDGGTVYDVKTTRMLGAGDFARINRLQRDLPAALDTLTNATESTPEEELSAAVNVERHLNSFVKLLVAEMPLERIEVIPFAMKAEFLDWWKKAQDQAEGDADAATAGKSRAGRRTQERPSPA